MYVLHQYLWKYQSNYASRIALQALLSTSSRARIDMGLNPCGCIRILLCLLVSFNVLCQMPALTCIVVSVRFHVVITPDPCTVLCLLHKVIAISSSLKCQLIFNLEASPRLWAATLVTLGLQLSSRWGCNSRHAIITKCNSCLCGITTNSRSIPSHPTWTWYLRPFARA